MGTAKDIMYFLSSRHGIQVEEDAVRSSIITELCGTPPVENSPSLLAIDSAKGALAKLSEGSCSDDDGTKEDEESEDEDDAPVPAMDIAQMLSLLLIPFLRDGNSDGKNQEAVGSVVEIALDTIWAELMSHSMDVSSSSAGGGSGRVLVTPELLREIMAIFGEVEVSDEMLEGMVAAAAGGTNQKNGQFYLTKSSFLRALTGDVQLFNPNVNESDTTHFDDARIAAKKRDPSITEKEDSSMVVFTSVYTAANIDNNADTYRSTGWFTLVWTR